MSINLKMFPFMKLQGPQTHITEPYVSVPPALVIVDETGAVWTLGFQMAAPTSALQQRYETRIEAPNGEFAFTVLRDGQRVCDEFASRIERRQGRIRIFTRSGWKHWCGRSFI
jgi:hypothetical protein